MRDSDPAQPFAFHCWSALGVAQVLELQEHGTPNTAPSVILIQNFPEQIAVAVANGLLVIKAAAMSAEHNVIWLEEERSHMVPTKSGAQH